LYDLDAKKNAFDRAKQQQKSPRKEGFRKSEGKGTVEKVPGDRVETKERSLRGNGLSRHYDGSGR
jgi:hypothetical protein